MAIGKQTKAHACGFCLLVSATVYLRRSEIRASVDQAGEDSVVGAARADAVVLGEEDGRAVGAGLVPALDGSTDGAGEDGEEQLEGHLPLVGDLHVEDAQLLLVEALVAVDEVSRAGILGHQGALLEHQEVLLQAALLGEHLDVVHQLCARDALERIADSVRAADVSWVCI
jgi:hypothetical protein